MAFETGLPVCAGDDQPDDISPQALILSAVTRLAGAHAYQDLSVEGICAMAGVSRRSFGEHFTDVADCFATAAERRGPKAIQCCAGLRNAESSAEIGAQRAIEVLCMEVAFDPALASLCFGEILEAEGRGAECRQRLTAEIAELLFPNAAQAHQAHLSRQAVAGAIWSAIRQHVLTGRAPKLLRVAPALAVLATCTG